jgi:hypothetical protein
MSFISGRVERVSMSEKSRDEFPQNSERTTASGSPEDGTTPEQELDQYPHGIKLLFIAAALILSIFMVRNILDGIDIAC